MQDKPQIKSGQIVEYKIVRGMFNQHERRDAAQALTDQVNSALKDGWEPCGGPFPLDDKQLVQALVKKSW